MPKLIRTWISHQVSAVHGSSMHRSNISSLCLNTCCASHWNLDTISSSLRSPSHQVQSGLVHTSNSFSSSWYGTAIVLFSNCKYHVVQTIIGPAISTGAIYVPQLSSSLPYPNTQRFPCGPSMCVAPDPWCSVGWWKGVSPSQICWGESSKQILRPRNPDASEKGATVFRV